MRRVIPGMHPDTEILVYVMMDTDKFGVLGESGSSARSSFVCTIMLVVQFKVMCNKNLYKFHV